MSRLASLAVIAALLSACLAAPAQAQLSRTFVSAASGNDANNCDRATPCRTFQGAHDKTNSDGEITVLDPGGYGAVTITKSISIVNDGVGVAGMLVSGDTTGITINGGPATYVNLRGITVQGIGFGGGTGLRFNSGFSLTVTNCVFRNHTGEGIRFAPTAGGIHNLSIADTLVADNGNDGIDVAGETAGVTVRAALARVQMVNNALAGLSVDGEHATGTVDVTVTDSVSGNNNVGFFAASGTGHARTTLTVFRSVGANNAIAGLLAVEAATLRVGQSTIAGNAKAWSVTSDNGGIMAGTVQSFGDNYIAGNGDGDPAPPALARR